MNILVIRDSNSTINQEWHNERRMEKLPSKHALLRIFLDQSQGAMVNMSYECMKKPSYVAATRRSKNISCKHDTSSWSHSGIFLTLTHTFVNNQRGQTAKIPWSAICGYYDDWMLDDVGLSFLGFFVLDEEGCSLSADKVLRSSAHRCWAGLKSANALLLLRLRTRAITPTCQRKLG